MKTIYQTIKENIQGAGIEGIVYEEGYPKDKIKLSGDPIEDEDMDTLSPLLRALEIIRTTIQDFHNQMPLEASETDIEVSFYHLPGEEEWAITIGDGR